jgi:hypothetical protein
MSIVRHEHRRRVAGGEQPRQLREQARVGPVVEPFERLVEQHQGRTERDGV